MEPPFTSFMGQVFWPTFIWYNNRLAPYADRLVLRSLREVTSNSYGDVSLPFINYIVNSLCGHNPNHWENCGGTMRWTRFITVSKLRKTDPEAWPIYRTESISDTTSVVPPQIGLVQCPNFECHMSMMNQHMYLFESWPPGCYHGISWNIMDIVTA